MAHDTFAPIYTGIKKAFVGGGRRLELEVLEGLAWFADSYGFAYPGIKRLASTIHRGEKTVERALNDLIAWNLVKMHVTENRLRRGKPQVDFQINPLALYIREELEQVAWDAWGENRVINAPFSVKSDKVGVDLNLTESQPDRTRISNQNQEPKTRTKPNPEPEPQRTSLENGVSTDDSQTQRISPIGQEYDKESRTHSATAQKQRESAQTQRDEVAVAESETHVPPAGGAADDGGAKLAVYASPLADFESEQLAQYLRTHLPTQLKQARSIVDTYGIDHVNKGIEWLNERRRVSPVQNPAGLFVWAFQSGEVPKPQANEAQQLVSGKYSEFFER